MNSTVVVSKTWRSEWILLVLFVASSLLSPILSHKFSWSLITGELFSYGDRTVILTLPLFWLVPFVVLSLILFRIYDVRFSVDSKGIESRVGILGFNQRIVRVRYEDVRSVEIDQTLLERFLDIGNLAIGTAATSGIEIYFEGVAAPAEVQQMIQSERDRRQVLRSEPAQQQMAQNSD